MFDPLSESGARPAPFPSDLPPETNGPPASPDDLASGVYAQLRAIAQRHMRQERPGHTLSATALVNEAFVRLACTAPSAWQDDARFVAAAVTAMRRILVEHARQRTAARRGGPAARRAALQLSDLPDPASDEECAGFLILDAAIQRLSTVDADAAAVVRLRYFGGLSVGQTAQALGRSAPTVKRAWAFARAWLKEAIERDS